MRTIGDERVIPRRMIGCLRLAASASIRLRRT
jgi:hypothetical protein